MDNKQHITLQVGAHHLAYNIAPELEESYRKAAVLLNQRYDFYRSRMPKASAELVWVYVALEVGLNLCDDSRKKNIQPILERVQAMNQKIEQQINTEL